MTTLDMPRPTGRAPGSVAQGRAAPPALKAAQRAERERRRTEVAEMVLRRMTYAEMMEALAQLDPPIIVRSHSTLADDRKVILERWREHALEHVSVHVADELTRLEAIMQANLGLALAGDEAAARTYFGGHDRKVKLLGLAAPARVELTGASGGPIEVKETPEQLRARGLAVLDQVAPVIDAASTVKELP